jgi:hypothetical protein
LRLQKRFNSVWCRFTVKLERRRNDLISDALPFGRLWYGEPNAVSNAVGYAEHCSGSHDAVIRVYDNAGSATETREQPGDFKEA